MEERSFERILEGLLEEARRDFPELDTREGSLIYSALAPAALEVSRIHAALNFALQMSFADTAGREFLIRRAAEHGMEPIPASAAQIEAEIDPPELTIPLGRRFRAGNVVYEVTGISADGHPILTAEQAGAVGNQSGGRLIPLDFIDGLRSAAIRALILPGRDEEHTESLRERYMESRRIQAFGGNIKSYREKVLTLPGVGGVQVFPAHAGPGTVKVGILAADLSPPSPALVRSVQEVLDPKDITGEGRAWAPIGHEVTVVGATLRPIMIATNLSLARGVNAELVRERARDAVETYFHELRVAWGRGHARIVRVSQMDTRLLDIEGVIDVTDTELDGQSRNLALEEMQVPSLGSFAAR